MPLLPAIFGGALLIFGFVCINTSVSDSWIHGTSMSIFYILLGLVILAIAYF
ncbi:hypothetical protein IID20_04250 [Patescibacteria group bacterium]|nr:hypothetical protein [Patescibacteria group bacterium]